ncbi:MAG: TolC family protein [Gemmataceae bacterium]|nr:TolC family protein [Gemmataceae bacterium]MCI0739378.1 TolC family protein [Gemmataceae bacterium]
MRGGRHFWIVFGLAGVVASCVGAQSTAPSHFDLRSLWSLAQDNLPELREAAADYEAAVGQAIQAGAYPNPRLQYVHDLVGSAVNPRGHVALALHQEIITGGKRQLDRAIAGRHLEQATLALDARRIEMQSRLRRDYYDYLNLLATAQVHRDTIKTIEEALRLSRQLLEKAKLGAQTDILALETLLEEAQSAAEKTNAALHSAWRQLAADVGLADLATPKTIGGLPAQPPSLREDEVWQRVLAAHPALRQAQLDADSARLAWQRARAEAIPNITFGAGYSRDFIEETSGAILSVEAPLPFWDKKTGLVRQAEARLNKAHATLKSTEFKLQREAAEAWARHQAAQRNSDRQQNDIVPRLQKRRDLLRQAYQAAAGKVTFSDVLLAEQALLAARLSQTELRRDMWRAVADLLGLMQKELD